MTLVDLFVYLAVGRLLIWLLQVAGPLRLVWGLNSYLKEFSECDLCLGFWVYLVLGLCRGQLTIFGLWAWWLEVVVLAAVATFTMHVMAIGFKEKFRGFPTILE